MSGSLAPLVLYLRPTDVILAWLLLVCERKVVVCGSCSEHVVGTCEALLSLQHPLRWVVSYVPSLPPALIHIVNAPNPYLIGWNGSADEILLESGQDPPAILDMDAGELVIDTETKSQYRLPQHIMKGLKNVLDFSEPRDAAQRAGQQAARAAGVRTEGGDEESASIRHGAARLSSLGLVRGSRADGVGEGGSAVAPA